jgi:putative membrane protein
MAHCRCCSVEWRSPKSLTQFVDIEIAEQETVGAILKAIQTNAAPTGSTPSPSDADLMQNLDDTGKASVEKLRAMHAGSEFDRDYICYEVEGHRKLLDIQEVYLKAPDISIRPMSRNSRGA